MALLSPHKVKRSANVRHSSGKREIKRFYKNVTISQQDGQFEINLDRKRLKTPMGKILRLPTEGLALAVATEWDRQEGVLEQSSMYLTNLSNAATDKPVPQSPAERASDILEFLETDTVRFRVEEPAHLVQLQALAWDPVVKWVQDRHQVEITWTDSIVAPPVAGETREKIGRYLTSYDSWSLIGLQAIVEGLKSVILALAVVDRHLSVETAVALSRLEEEYQIAQWGNVEWAHDITALHLRASVAASVLFIHLNTEVSSTNRKSAPKS
ncbi:ATP synthase mitochondrial F1 complex assembly factor 2 [Hypsibius exemplaris]|uniref:ATP synthase mitochondrial F1 complex assembly factor 2 n=1 Tax=Hypsibius exemplaris TaxID=2072580 RepID=A0A1W0XBD9_HYPEX|nr:ATP synthase mitochondrial F1 complex assembly factor 2 [Hypsibius exemplaris]